MQKYLNKFTVLLLSAALLASCGSTKMIQAGYKSVPETNQQVNQNINTQPQNSQTGENDKDKPQVDLKAIKANEMGKIMILMYHDIGKTEGEWSRTPENFRKDLETLYNKGYRAISLKDYLNNNINVPAGTTPVVITFDDGTLGQFRVFQDKGDFVVDPDCAVGILEDFYKEHPDFGLEATFYIYYPVPFRQKDLIEEKLKYIVDKGMDIGNHTYNHDNLKKFDAEKIQKTLGRNVEETLKYLPGYEVDSLALPYGIKPHGENLYQYVIKGKYGNTDYNNRGILLVGSNPALPLYNVKADPANIPRIRASEMDTAGTGLYDWLKYFDKHPEEKYISDGNPDAVSIPEGKGKNLNRDVLKGKEIVIYNDK